jgi:hypothetical protein
MNVVLPHSKQQSLHLILVDVRVADSQANDGEEKARKDQPESE